MTLKFCSLGLRLRQWAAGIAKIGANAKKLSVKMLAVKTRTVNISEHEKGKILVEFVLSCEKMCSPALQVQNKAKFEMCLTSQPHGNKGWRGCVFVGNHLKRPKIESICNSVLANSPHLNGIDTAMTPSAVVLMRAPCGRTYAISNNRRRSTLQKNRSPFIGSDSKLKKYIQVLSGLRMHLTKGPHCDKHALLIQGSPRTSNSQ
jgi:hypothetical protein